MTDQLRALIEQWGERADQLERLARANAVDHQSLAAALRSGWGGELTTIERGIVNDHHGDPEAPAGAAPHLENWDLYHNLYRRTTACGFDQAAQSYQQTPPTCCMDCQMNWFILQLRRAAAVSRLPPQLQKEGR